jgi:uncharacterized protein (TIGR03435 family)
MTRRQGGPGTADPGHMMFRNTPLLTLLADAWNVQPSQIVGPGWLSEMAARPRLPDGKFDVEAVVPPNATKEDARIMLQNLLGDRFGLVLHRESKVLDVWNLELAKDAPALTKTNIDPNLPSVTPMDVDAKSISLDKNSCVILDRPGILTYMTRTPAGTSFCYAAKAQTISQLAEFLAQHGLDDKPVVDKTGMDGAYDFKWIQSPGIPGAPGGRPILQIEDDLSRQVGIKVTSGKGPVDVLVIDKLNKDPTGN